jgi:hypothetical protein
MEAVFEVWVVLARWVKQLGLEGKQEEHIEVVWAKAILMKHHTHEHVMMVGVWSFFTN